MKYLLIFSIALTVQTGFAQTCEPSSPEMAQYVTQKDWTPYAIKDNSDAPAINGFIDQENRFHMDDLTRGGPMAAQVSVDPANASYKDFFTFCKNSDSKGEFLRTMRRTHENNKYSVSLRYLPAITGFKNNPLIDQNFRETSLEVTLNFDEHSLISTLEFQPNSVKAEIYRNIKKQIAEQKEWGLIQLDLTGLDDVVCDLIQGHITLAVRKSAISNTPLVRQKKDVEPTDIQTYYQTLKQNVPASFTKEMALYVAGRTQAKLESNQQIVPLGDKKGFEVLKSLMDPTLSKIADLDSASLSCVSDRLQSYDTSLIQHYFDIQFKFPSLDQLAPQDLGQKQ